MKEIIKKHGVEIFGICPFEKIADSLIECRSKNRLPTNSKSVICMLFPYYSAIGKRNISRYATIKDYHIVVNNILSKIELDLKNKYNKYSFVHFCDNSPIPEKTSAALAGLGVIGDNKLLINDKYGSWVFIGEIVTDMEIECGTVEVKGCLHCGCCEENCPSAVLKEEIFDKNKCLSMVTQKKRDLSSEEKELMKNSGCVWGCDICQECCPLNKNVEETNIDEFLKDIYPNVNIYDYDKLSNRAYQWRKKNVIERNIRILSLKDDNNNF